MGDFSMLQDIPEMYRHCKAVEDKDMTAIDFITDHLVNIDGIFDNHDGGDEQKPHEPKHTVHHGMPIVLSDALYSFDVINHITNLSDPLITLSHFMPSGYISKIYRPPVA